MEDLDWKLNGVYQVFVDSLGEAAMIAGTIHDRRIKGKVNEMLREEAIHLAQFRKRLFDLLNE